MKKAVLVFFTIIFSLNTVLGQTKIELDSNIESKYFDKPPPGNVPLIFAPGLISTGNYERAITFSPDYNEVYYQMRGRKYNTYIIQIRKKQDGWVKPEMAPFSGITGYDDNYPFYSPDGKRLFFNSKRPVETGGEIQNHDDIWYLDKIASGWGNPVHLLFPINTDNYESTPSVAENGNLYFESNRESESGDWGIFMSEYKNGEYQKPEKLPAPINTGKFEGHVFIAPDESFLLFDSNREGGYGDLDIYVCFNIDGTWSEAFNLGDKINTYSHEVAPYVSPDGKYLFFTSFKLNPDKSEHKEKKFTYDEVKDILNNPGNGNGDIYWVDFKVIEQLYPAN